MSCTYFTLNMLTLSVYIKRKPQLIFFLTWELRGKKCLCWVLRVGVWESQGQENISDSERLNPVQISIKLPLRDFVQVNAGVLWQHGRAFYVLASEFQERAFLYKYISGSGCIF